MMNSNINFNSYKKKDDLLEQLSQCIAKNLQESIDENAKATLIVSGGNTPKPLFEKLSLIDIQWDKVSVGLCDERWIDSTHKDSNERLVKAYLIQQNAKDAKFIGLYLDKVSVDDAQQICSKNVQDNLLPIDVIILGMGSDAHTASLFPNNPKLKEAYDLDSELSCIAVEPDYASHSRMSLNLKTILSAKNLYLHFETQEKLSVYKEALNGDDHFAMPIRSVLHQDRKTMEVYFC